MDYWYPVKQEEYYAESSSSPGTMAAPPAPVPMEVLNDTGPPPFLIKTYEMVEDPTTDKIVSWSRGGESIVVWDANAFSSRFLPRHFKHNNFSSFIRQLNTYGFRKIDPDRWEFANELFLRGHKHLLKNITRRKSSQQEPPLGPCVELGGSGLDTEVDGLRRDKQALFMELVKLRQQQQATRAYVQSIELRIQGTEQRLQHILSFLAEVMQYPEIVQQFVQHKEEKKQLQEAITRRRRPIVQEEGPSTRASIKTESSNYYGNPNYGGSELEALALEIQGFRRRTNRLVQEEAEEDGGEMDRGFWYELLNQEKVFNELDDEEEVNILADRLEFLGSNPK